MSDWNDREFVLRAVESFPLTLEFAGQALFTDREVVIAAD